MEKYRKLSHDEMEKIKELLEKKLKRIHATVEIDSNYTTLYCSMKVDGQTESSWEQYSYGVNIKSDLGECRLLEHFSIDEPIENVVWDLAYNAISELDENFIYKFSDILTGNN